MAEKGAGIFSKKGVLGWLLALTICYQMIYQAVMWSKTEGESIWDECDSGGATLADSPVCLEKKLFSSWQEEERKEEAWARMDPTLESLQKDGALVKLPRHSMLANTTNSTAQELHRSEAPDELHAVNAATTIDEEPCLLDCHYKQKQGWKECLEKCVLVTPPLETRPANSTAQELHSSQESAKENSTSVASSPEVDGDRRAASMGSAIATDVPDISTSLSPVASDGIRWDGVQKWSASSTQPSLRGTADSEGAASVTWAQLRHLHWEDRHPKVACITAIPSGSAAPPTGQLRRKLSHLVSMFMQQDYAGPKELVLIYHHLDHEAEKLTRKYADGNFVKAIAARGEEQLPSTTGLRYGAWTANDTDVIARWDFNERHHHQRLSTQVRALAKTRRPACLIKHPGVTAPEGEFAADAIMTWETSLAGERNWMEKFWYPLLGSWAPDPLDANSRFVVQVEMDTEHNLV
eukprot:gnl/TRDRNA2_/TRDRNA2_185039_c0_seq1.p1 gnl/TRDRNA2_/TRDRNA2_185039_c0~~gnl/TRDRNA2_/TRDRNA2_185039_c0_seq1.p1  ORF type:complete len:465 (-),score=83.27 gnl/TRDRNA2_/TRDRNA2_185039_c0_seq1:62-1456(-)